MVGKKNDYLKLIKILVSVNFPPVLNQELKSKEKKVIILLLLTRPQITYKNVADTNPLIITSILSFY